MKLDEIGPWSVDKLQILKTYSELYAKVLVNFPGLKFGYIDGFAGAGQHKLKGTGQIIDGSPLNALNIRPAFHEYHFVERDHDRVGQLRALAKDQTNVTVHEGDCNRVLIDDVFPRFLFSDYKRALCFLDPYGTHLRWEVLAKAAEMQTIEIFLNFPINDMNRNAKRRNLSEVKPSERARMDAFWGGGSWHDAMFPESGQFSLFDEPPEKETAANEAFAEAFRKRLNEKAGFKHVPKPIPMRNGSNSEVYYLFFASNNKAGGQIGAGVFKQHLRSPLGASVQTSSRRPEEPETMP